MRHTGPPTLFAIAQTVRLSSPECASGAPVHRQTTPTAIPPRSTKPQRLPFCEHWIRRATQHADPAIFAAEQEKIFRKTWLYVGYDGLVPNADDYHCATLVGEPVMLSRRKNGQTHALFNRCGHRGAKVLQDCSGNAKVLSRTYHVLGLLFGWRNGRRAEASGFSDCGIEGTRIRAWCGRRAWEIGRYDSACQRFRFKTVGSVQLGRSAVCHKRKTNVNAEELSSPPPVERIGGESFPRYGIPTQLSEFHKITSCGFRASYNPALASYARGEITIDRGAR